MLNRKEGRQWRENTKQKAPDRFSRLEVFEKAATKKDDHNHPNLLQRVDYRYEDGNIDIGGNVIKDSMIRAHKIILQQTNDFRWKRPNRMPTLPPKASPSTRSMSINVYATRASGGAICIIGTSARACRIIGHSCKCM